MNITEIKNFTKFTCRPKDESQNYYILPAREYRAMKEDDENIFVYAPKKTRRGWRFSTSYFEKHFDYYIKTESDENEEWHNRLKNAIKKMEKSGLWENVKTVFQNLLSMDINEQNEIREIRWRWLDGLSYQEQIEQNEKDIADKYEKKYPFLFTVNESGEKIFNSEYVESYTRCKTKSMYFGKWRNTDTKQRIAEAMANKTEITERGYTSYDVTFSYVPEQNRAYYSEEYRGCGNGHYYLAIDANTALFYEDD